MKISDIRFYESKTLSEKSMGFQYVGTIYRLDYKQLAAHILRLVMKLREMNFMMEPDHLYIALTPALGEKMMHIRALNAFKEKVAFSTVYYGVKQLKFNISPNNTKMPFLIRAAGEILQTYFCANDDERTQVADCVEKTLMLGPDMEIVYKETQSSVAKVQILAKVLDSNKILPTVRICAKQGVQEDFTLALVELETFKNQFGTVSIAKNKVTIKPRNNIFAQKEKLESLEFQIEVK